MGTRGHRLAYELAMFAASLLAEKILPDVNGSSEKSSDQLWWYVEPIIITPTL